MTRLMRGKAAIGAGQDLERRVSPNSHRRHQWHKIGEGSTLWERPNRKGSSIFGMILPWIMHRRLISHGRILDLQEW